MHTIYHTDAVIIKSQDTGEADKNFWLFTKNFGLIRAKATGVRLGSAKLRGHLVDYALVKVDLVRGREVWRLIGASLILNPLPFKLSNYLNRAYLRVLSTLERFLIDEGEQPELYDHIAQSVYLVNQIYQNKDVISEEVIKNYDALSIWKIFIYLGYVAIDDSENNLFQRPLAESIFLLKDVGRKKIISTTNEAIKETHL